MSRDLEHDERIKRSLEMWTGSAGLQPPSPEFIRARGTGRVRRKRAATAVTSLAAVAALALALVQFGQSPGIRHPSRLSQSSSLSYLMSHVSRAHPRVTASETAAAARADNLLLTETTRALIGTSGMDNVLVSPSSLAEVLTQLELGARGTTGAQIAAALGEKGVSPAKQAVEWDLLSQHLASDAQQAGVVLRQRNGIFLEKTLSVEPAFLNALATDFGEGIWRADFSGDPAAAAREISTWASEVVHFRSPALLSEDAVTDQTAFVVANAVHFQAGWSTESRFSRRMTALAPFHLADGTSSAVETMHLTRGLPATFSHGVTAVELPYSGARFSALVIEPSSGSLASLVGSLTPARLGSIVGGLRQTSVAVSLPRFSIAASTSFNDALRSLGIRDAYSASADFSGVTSAPVALSQVDQSEQITVSEAGTDASAVSSSALVPQQADVHSLTANFDHPFLFLVRDDSTGAVLFEAAVANPDAST